MAAREFKLSVLDLSPVPSGSTSRDALQNTLDLARFTDELGYTRYWLAEHHNTPLIASSSPEIMIAEVANVTRRLRVGSGGIMLPNHSPLNVAENFRVLQALHPGRIDLGLGRAPGTDPITALALRRSRDAVNADDFPQQLDELLAYLHGEQPKSAVFQQIRAMPDDVPPPEIWILGSSDFSAQLSAQMGLRFAFAHHIQPWPAIPALNFYHQNFKPASSLRQPQSLIAVSVVCAETTERAEELARSLELTLLRFRTGKRSRLPTVAEAEEYPYSEGERLIIAQSRERFFVGAPDVVRRQVASLTEQSGTHEIMITTMIHDHAARRRSYELMAEAFNLAASTVSERAHGI